MRFDEGTPFRLPLVPMWVVSLAEVNDHELIENASWVHQDVTP